jgi:hypothetical protein
MVTVALENWQLNCRNSPRPSRGGFVRLYACATRVFNLQKSSFESVRNNTVIRASKYVPFHERIGGRSFLASRDLFSGKVSGPPSFLVSAILCSA